MSAVNYYRSQRNLLVFIAFNKTVPHSTERAVRSNWILPPGDCKVLRMDDDALRYLDAIYY